MIGIKGIAIGSSIALAIGLSGGWKAHSTYAKAKHAQALEDAQEAANQVIEAANAELQERRMENMELSTQLTIAQANVRTEFRTITQEVPKYVPQNTSDCNCDLGSDFIGLFNRSATRGQNNSASTPKPTGYISDTMPTGASDLAGGN